MKPKFLTKIIAIILAIVILAPSVVFADQLDDQIKELDKKINQNKSSEKQKHDEADTLAKKIESIKNEISSAQDALDKTRLEVAQSERDITKTNADLNHQKDLLRANVRLIYKRGDTSEVEILASSDNLSDFVGRQQSMQNIKDKINQNLDLINKLKQKLEEENQKLTTRLGQQKAITDGLNGKKLEQQNILSATKGDEAKYKGEVKKLEEQKAAVAQQIASRVASLNKIAGSSNLGSVLSNPIIGYMGSTGNSTGPHLHFSTLDPNGNFVNPSSAGFNWQVVTTGSVTQSYTGPNYPYNHNGIDIANSIGTPIRAAADGVVTIKASGYNGGWGNYIVIRHSNGYSTLYAHLSSFH